MDYLIYQAYPLDKQFLSFSSTLEWPFSAKLSPLCTLNKSLAALKRWSQQVFYLTLKLPKSRRQNFRLQFLKKLNPSNIILRIKRLEGK